MLSALAAMALSPLLPGRGEAHAQMTMTLESAGRGEGVSALGQSGTDGSAGVVTGESAEAVFAEVQQLMASHRVWERFPTTV